MKKFLAILSALMLMIMAVLPLANASADETKTFDITFRNGIKYGMTADQVTAAETQSLRTQNFGDTQNPHVTILTTDNFDISGYNGAIQYLFYDGSLFGVLYTYGDQSKFDEFMSSDKELYGQPTVDSIEGLANWVKAVTGNQPELTGEQYIWDLGNKVTLTMAKFGTSFICLFLNGN